MNDLPEDNKDQTPAPQRGRRPSRDTLNLVIAVCAVLISAASFVASYMQSEAAFRQVKAETWPLIQIDHGNYDIASGEHILYLKVENSGVGPANIKNFRLFYKGKHIGGYPQLIRECCLDIPASDVAGFRAAMKDLFVLNSSLAPVILAPGDSRDFFRIQYRGDGEALWKKIDEARWDLSAKSCYCSLLDECFETDFVADPVEVDHCEMDPSAVSPEKRKRPGEATPAK
jgi:hypothetical protein